MKSKIMRILALLIISCMLLSVFPTFVNAKSGDNIVLECSDNVCTIAPGDEGEFKISVTNLGGDDTIELSAWVPSNWNYSFIYQAHFVNNITLKQNETKSVALRVYVPADAEIKEHPIIIFSRAQNSAEYDYVVITVVVKKSYDIEMVAKEKIIVVPVGGHAETPLELRNIGENEGYVNLSVSSDLADIESPVFLLQGESENISLRIHAPFNFTVGNYLINVTATFFNTNISVNITIRVVKPTKILLVEKEKAQNLKDALNDTFYDYDIANLSRIFLRDYDLVIWYCGKKWFDTITLSEQKNLSSYLDNGGALWLIGQDVLDETGLNDFVVNYLHVAECEQNAGFDRLIGVSGDPIGDRINFSVTENWFADSLTPDDESFGVFYGKNNYSAIGYSGIYNVVFFAFDFSVIQNNDDRNEIVNRVVIWFVEGVEMLTCINNISMITPGNSTEYTITVKNNYDYENIINFTVSAPLRWEVSFNESIVIGAKETKNVTLTITCPFDAGMGDYIISFYGKSQNGVTDSIMLVARVSLPWSILLVNDCAFDFENILSSAFYYYDVFNVDLNGPNASVMEKYDVVIWNTGMEWKDTLTFSDQENISLYLDNGGNLWLIGQDILYDLGLNDFVTRYLHVANADQDIGLPAIMRSVPNNPATESISCSIVAEKDDYADALTPDNNATGVFFGNVNYSAISYFKTYKVVFFAFDFLRIANESDQEKVVTDILNWLAQKEPLITIETIYFSKADPEEGEIIQIYANISNRGNKGSENITVRFIIDNYIAGEINISALQEGEWYNTSITWKAVKGMHLVKVEVEHMCSTKVLEVAEKKKEIELSPYVIYIAVFMCIIAVVFIFLRMRRKRR